jgi:hypothetical protein
MFKIILIAAAVSLSADIVVGQCVLDTVGYFTFDDVCSPARLEAALNTNGCTLAGLKFDVDDLAHACEEAAV